MRGARGTGRLLIAGKLACSLTHLGRRGVFPPPASLARVPDQRQHPKPTALLFTFDSQPTRSQTCYLGPPPPAPPPNLTRGRESTGGAEGTAALANHSQSCVLAHSLIGSPGDRPSSNGCLPGEDCRDFPLCQARWSQRESRGERGKPGKMGAGSSGDWAEDWVPHRYWLEPESGRGNVLPSLHLPSPGPECGLSCQNSRRLDFGAALGTSPEESWE